MDKNEDVVQLLKAYNQEHIVKLLNKLCYKINIYFNIRYIMILFKWVFIWIIIKINMIR